MEAFHDTFKCTVWKNKKFTLTWKKYFVKTQLLWICSESNAITSWRKIKLPLQHTVWKLQDFSVTRNFYVKSILVGLEDQKMLFWGFYRPWIFIHEINFRGFEMSKSAILTILETWNCSYCKILALKVAKIPSKMYSRSLNLSSENQFWVFESDNLIWRIWRKIWVTEKFLNSAHYYCTAKTTINCQMTTRFAPSTISLFPHFLEIKTISRKKITWNRVRRVLISNDVGIRFVLWSFNCTQSKYCF